MPKRPAPADGPEETDGILEQEWVVKEEEEEEEEEEEARPGARFLTPTAYICVHIQLKSKILHQFYPLESVWPK